MESTANSHFADGHLRSKARVAKTKTEPNLLLEDGEEPGINDGGVHQAYLAEKLLSRKEESVGDGGGLTKRDGHEVLSLRPWGGVILRQEPPFKVSGSTSRISHMSPARHTKTRDSYYTLLLHFRQTTAADA